MNILHFTIYFRKLLCKSILKIELYDIKNSSGSSYDMKNKIDFDEAFNSQHFCFNHVIGEVIQLNSFNERK